MADNAQNIQPQQPVQPIERPVREFIQVDTSTNAYMAKGDKSVLVTPKSLKDS